MPITFRTESKDQIPADATNVQEVEFKYNHSDEVVRKGFTYDVYTGKCLALRERNMYDDSDFYMLVWDDEKQKPVQVMTWTTRFGCSGLVAETIDADEETRAKYEAWAKAEREAEEALRQRQRDAEVHVGKDAEVVKGRKIAIGTRGRVFWLGNNGYGMSVGLELVNGDRVFTSMKNVVGRV